MNGWCKFVNEDEQKIIVRYSLEENNTCDGELTLDKKTQEIEILRLASGATIALTNHFICSVRGRIRSGFEFNKLYYLAVG